jgi:hypothetical protein
VKINYKILSIPPYISTSWDNVTSLHLEKRDDETLLVVGLNNGVCIEVPLLEQPIIDAIFAIHAKVIEQESQISSAVPSSGNFSNSGRKEQVFTFGFPLPVSMENLEQLGTFLQHSSAQSDAADLPYGVLAKVSDLVKTIGIEDPSVLPKPEPHCNCPHCQIARALHQGLGELEEREANADKEGSHEGSHDENQAQEEPISLEDLRFREWAVYQKGDRVYRVTNPLDEKEYYDVYLGESTGCTCGQKNCEHVRTVLNH